MRLHYTRPAYQNVNSSGVHNQCMEEVSGHQNPRIYRIFFLILVFRLKKGKAVGPCQSLRASIAIIFGMDEGGVLGR